MLRRNFLSGICASLPFASYAVNNLTINSVINLNKLGVISAYRPIDKFHELGNICDVFIAPASLFDKIKPFCQPINYDLLTNLSEYSQIHEAYKYTIARQFLVVGMNQKRLKKSENSWEKILTSPQVAYLNSPNVQKILTKYGNYPDSSPIAWEDSQFFLSWNQLANEFILQNPQWRLIIPSEGTIIDEIFVAINAKTRNLSGVYRFLNLILSNDMAYKISNEAFVETINKNAIRELPHEIKANKAIFLPHKTNILN